MTKGFEPDDRLQAVAEAYSLDAVDFARAHYSKSLDWSDASVRDVEAIAEHLHESFPDPLPPDSWVDSQ